MQADEPVADTELRRRGVDRDRITARRHGAVRDEAKHKRHRCHRSHPALFRIDIMHS